MNETNYISAIRPNLRSDKQNKDLKAYNKKLQKFGKEIVDGVMKKFAHSKTKPKTGAERMSALRKGMTQEQREKAKTLNQERVELHRIAQSEAEKEDSRNKNKERYMQKRATQDCEATQKRKKE